MGGGITALFARLMHGIRNTFRIDQLRAPVGHIRDNVAPLLAEKVIVVVTTAHIV